MNDEIKNHIRRLKSLPIGTTIVHIGTKTNLQFAGIHECDVDRVLFSSSKCNDCIGQVWYTLEESSGKVCPLSEVSVAKTGGFERVLQPKFKIPNLDFLSEKDFQL